MEKLIVCANYADAEYEYIFEVEMNDEEKQNLEKVYKEKYEYDGAEYFYDYVKEKYGNYKDLEVTKEDEEEDDGHYYGDDYRFQEI